MTERSHQADPSAAVHACAGVTAPARLAQDVAERLRTIAPVDELERRVIAIDGCAGGCSSRQLAGQGVEVEAVSLDLLGIEARAALDEDAVDALAAEIAARLRRPHARATLAPRKRQDPPAPSAASVRAPHTADDYLFAISLLTSPIAACGVVASDMPTLASHVARALGVSRAAAGEMLARMEEAGEIDRGPDRTIVLTQQGDAAAKRVVRRHRVVERFLTDVLGYTAGESHALALEVRGSFPDEAVERLRSLVSPATTCPHGWPLEPGTGIEAADDLVALPALDHGDRRPIAALAEHDGHVLARLCDLGLEPGVEVERRSTGTLLVDGSSMELDPQAEAAVLVLLDAR